MLLRHFGFREDPFGPTPDPRFLYSSPTHREALASLQYGFYNNRGFTALIAAPGMGKTTLLFWLLREIRQSARTVFLFDTQCEPRELIGYILRDLGIIPGRDNVEMHAQLNDVLVAEARAGKKFVVIIDEAQNLSDAALETVRLLTNFETPRAKLMQIVLSGQPQLADMLLSPSLVQLRQRVSTVCRLDRFSREETAAYIEHRLKLAGYQGAPLFTKDALRRIIEASEGTPRMINNLCFNALSLCCALSRKQVDADMVAEVISDHEWLPAAVQTSGAASEAAAATEAAAAQQPELQQVRQEPRSGNSWGWAAAALLAIAVSGAVALARTSEFRPSQRAVSSQAPKVSPVRITGSGQATIHTTTVSGTVTGTALTTPVEVTVAPNQTLGNIAMHYLGNYDQQRLQQIQALNPDLIDPDNIQPGQRIRLPGRVARNAAPQQK